MASSKEMTEGAPLPLIFNFTLPLLLGNLLQQTYSLIDAAIVGKFLGIHALASCLNLFEEIITFIVHQDKCREVLNFDFPDSFHS